MLTVEFNGLRLLKRLSAAVYRKRNVGSAAEHMGQSKVLADDGHHMWVGEGGSGSGMPHTPVMVREVLDCLDPQPGQVYVDMTFGAGGHTKAILAAQPDTVVYAIDRDPAAHNMAQNIAKQYGKSIRPVLGRFSELLYLLSSQNVQENTVDGFLFDVGASSMQFDQGGRGFSLSQDGPLDMRMDGERFGNKQPTAADVVNSLGEDDLYGIIKTYGEEKHARKISSAIVDARNKIPITTTKQLAGVVASALAPPGVFFAHDKLNRAVHPATKTFQALRIFVNDELNELYQGLQAARYFLKPGGRAIVITFHSLEDRVAKRYFQGVNMRQHGRMNIQQRKREGDLLKEEGLPEVEMHGPRKEWTVLTGKVMRPHWAEVMENPRARSAKLRAAIKN
ncbi:12S rRNA N(4)-cytidine methyltransferase METTL15-like isoform X1 [Branchiostoma floridae x Branchiostoma japonicum]